jgi:hypothetical protein
LSDDGLALIVGHLGDEAAILKGLLWATVYLLSRASPYAFVDTLVGFRGHLPVDNFGLAQGYL